MIKKPFTFSKALLASILGVFIAGMFVMGVFFGVFSLIVNSAQGGDVIEVKDNSILKIGLGGSIVEKGANLPEELENIPFLAGQGGTGLFEIRKAIINAKDDERIDGIYINPKLTMSAGWATVEGIRDALVDFKESGKFIYAYSEIYTEKSYYLASVADSIFMYPTGGMEFNGLAATPAFYKKMLEEKLGVEIKVFKVGTFKSAVEPFIKEKMSDANREQVGVFLGDMWSHYEKQISEARNIEPEKLKMLADSFSIEKPADAVAYGLVNEVKYEDEVFDLLMDKTGKEKVKDLEFISLKKYAKVKEDKSKRSKSRDKIAIVFAQGQIVDGKGQKDQIGSESLVKELRKVRMDSTIKAVVMRVNSPGGSALASDVIAREVNLIKEKKPIIVSMGDLAASGGYYISAGANRIFAEPNTLTGSIGVFGMLPNTQKFFEEKIGITYDRVTTNTMADLGNPNRPMEEFEAEKIQNSVNRIYSDFVEVVRSGRDYADFDAVDSIAQGRVWTGMRAKDLGLVDEIGNLDDAVAFASSEAGLEDGYRIRTYPKQKNPFEEMMGAMGGASIKDMPELAEFKEEIKMYEQIKSTLSMNGVYMLMPMNLDVE